MQNFARRARQTLIGDKAFYKAVLAIIIPVIIQNGISNFVNLLDNLMVGALGNEEMSGVAIANQLVFVFNLCVFGGLSGAGIFGAQFYGAGDIEGLRNTFRGAAGRHVYRAAGLQPPADFAVPAGRRRRSYGGKDAGLWP